MRREFSKRVRRDAWRRCKGKCEQCGRVMWSGDRIYDHIRPDACGGEPTLLNCQVICRGCDAAKTKKDVGFIAKQKRVRDRDIGIRRSRNSRSFLTNKNGPFQKKMSGEVVRR